MESCQNTDVHALLLEVQDYHFRKIQAMKSVKRCYLTLIKTRRDGGHGTLQEAVWKDKVTSASTLVSVSNDNNFTITKEENSKIEEEDKSNHLPHTLYWVQSLPSSSLRHAHAAFTLALSELATVATAASAIQQQLTRLTQSSKDKDS